MIVALHSYAHDSGISLAIAQELRSLGHDCFTFRYDSALPNGVDLVLSWGPYGRLLPVSAMLQALPAPRPVYIHWSTEGMPDLRLPWTPMRTMSRARSALGRFVSAAEYGMGPLAKPTISRMERRALRFRTLGDYMYLQSRRQVDALAEISAIYLTLHQRYGMPSFQAPFGSSPLWYEDLELERDIDVLWMGKRATKRRSNMLDDLRQELRRYHVNMLVVDNIENPFVIGEARTTLLNRAKITVNLLRTWYDDNFLRFVLAAPNQSLVITEPVLAHCPEARPGRHYVSAPPNQLAQTIVHYLDNCDERQRIVRNAHRLTVGELTLARSVSRIMTHANILKRRL